MAKYTATINGRGANEMDGWRSDVIESDRTLDELNDFGGGGDFSMHFEEVEEQPVAEDEPSADDADDDGRPWWKVW